LQLLRIRRLEHNEPALASQSGGHGPQPRRDGEVHLLRAADSRGPDPSWARGSRRARRRSRDRVPVGMSRRRHRLRQPRGPSKQSRPASGGTVSLQPFGRLEHPAAYDVLGRLPQSEFRFARTRRGRVTMEEQHANPLTSPPQPPVIGAGYTFGSVTDKISAITLTRPTSRRWWLGLAVTFSLVMLLFYAIGMLLVRGIGIWGVNIPVGWGLAIVNFVWWIGIGHAGTLISAILLLLHQHWRTSINRFAEAMTLFAVACAGLFPLLHMGRPWFFYWLFPYPNTMHMWPTFRSPLVWALFAVSTFFTVSLLFWYVGLLPDLATLRDRSPSRVGRVIYGILAMGWRGSAYHWKRYEMTYLLLAGLATPLVLSVHTVVSFDF